MESLMPPKQKQSGFVASDVLAVELAKALRQLPAGEIAKALRAALPQGLAAPPSSPRIIRIREVVSRTGKCRTSIYQGIARGEFPKPIAIGQRFNGARGRGRTCMTELPVEGF